MRIALIAFFLPLLFLACDDEEPIPTNTDTNYEILREPVFGCSNYQLTNLSIDFQINEMSRFNDYYCYGGSENLVITSALTGESMVKRAFGANAFLPLEGNLIICGQNGIHQLKADGQFETLQADIACTDVLEGPNGELLFTKQGENSNYIHQLRNNSTQIYSDFYPVSTCVDIQQLVQGTGNTIWGTTCDGKLLQFEGPTFVRMFDSNNSVMGGRPADLLIAPYGETIVVAVKNGIGLYQILRLDGNELFELAALDATSADTPKQVAMSLPSIRDAYVRDNFLYLATSFAGCRGFHRFDVSKKSRLTDEDIAIIEDIGFDSQCLQDIYVASPEEVYVITDNNNIVQMGCL